MTRDEQRDLAARVVALSETLGKTFSPPAVKLWVEAVDDLPYPAVVQALRTLLKTSSFVPTPADVRQQIAPPIDEAAQAKLAWAEMFCEVKRIGSWGTPDLPLATLATVEALWGSWANCCATLPAGGPELVGWQKQWDQHYHSQAVVAQRRALSDGDVLVQLRTRLAERGLPAGRP